MRLSFFSLFAMATSLTAPAPAAAVAVAASAACKLPKVIAFDLDGTIWTPDMYELWGGGAPFTIERHDLLRDRSGRAVSLLGASAQILHELKHQDKWRDTVVAWVSKTDEPEWAAECLQKFRTQAPVAAAAAAASDGSAAEGVRLEEVATPGANQIFKADKQKHFKNIQRLYPHIDFSQMLFFDNERGNIDTVSKLGVKCVYAPRGMTSEVWLAGLRLFE